MPWIVGLDEAGYGPNLGPLVQAMTCWHVPSDDSDLIELSSTVVRRAKDRDDGRWLVDDSKKVHAGTHGLRKLEANVLAMVPVETWGALLGALHIDTVDFAAEPQFDATERLPTTATAEKIADLRTIVAQLPTFGITLGPVFAIARTAERFNAMLDADDNKASVLIVGVVALLRRVVELPGTDTVQVVVDRLGGRQSYAPLLRQAFPLGLPEMLAESPEVSAYRIELAGREFVFRFMIDADQAALPVAAGSMVAKYVRETAMRQFNRFWAGHVPGIRPTAGYPVDAKRFYAEITAMAQTLDIAERCIWRRK